MATSGVIFPYTTAGVIFPHNVRIRVPPTPDTISSIFKAVPKQTVIYIIYMKNWVAK